MSLSGARQLPAHVRQYSCCPLCGFTCCVCVCVCVCVRARNRRLVMTRLHVPCDVADSRTECTARMISPPPETSHRQHNVGLNPSAETKHINDTHTYTCIYIYIYTYVHTHTYIYIHMSISLSLIYIYTHIYIHTYTCFCLSIYLSIYLSI